MPLWVLDWAGFAWAHKKIAGTILLAIIVLGWASVHYLCGESRTEKRIDDRTGQIVGSNVAIEQANANAAEALANANDASKQAANVEAQANKIRNSNVKNVSLSNAMRDMCAAYPNAEGCNK